MPKMTSCQCGSWKPVFTAWSSVLLFPMRLFLFTIIWYRYILLNIIWSFTWTTWKLVGIPWATTQDRHFSPNESGILFASIRKIITSAAWGVKIWTDEYLERLNVSVEHEVLSTLLHTMFVKFPHVS